MVLPPKKNTQALSRRTFLRYAFYTAGAASTSTFLAACSSSGSLGNNLNPTNSGGGTTNPGNGSTTNPGSGGTTNPGGGGTTNPGTGGGTSMPNSGELNIPSGKLANIPSLEATTQVDGIRVPAGFTVRNVARHQTAVPNSSTGYTWHENPDGGACFELDASDPDAPGWVYTSNSELVPGGGCGALKFHLDTANDQTDIRDGYRILSGTRFNCAGGPTPWKTWLSCEEQGDGAVFETEPFTITDQDAVRKPSLGLFSHEAAAVDPVNKVIYLTEDSGSGRFYRWLPAPGDWDGDRAMMENGTLQVVEIEGFERGGYADDPADLRELRGITWTDVFRNDVAQGTARDESVDAQGFAPGTRFNGGEGLWYYALPAPANAVEATAQTPPVSNRAGGAVPTRGLVFFTTKGDNRVFALDIENQVIELVFDNDQIEPDYNDVDNLCVSPGGDILVAEDLIANAGNPSMMRIMVVIPNQQSKVLVEINAPGSEITGPAFSPDGSRLYFSSQRGPVQEIPGGVPATIPGTGATYELTIPPEFRG